MKKLYVLLFSVVALLTLNVTVMAIYTGEEDNTPSDNPEILMTGTDENTSFTLPSSFTAEGSTTSELKDISADQLSSFQGLVFDLPDYGTVTFTEAVDLSGAGLSDKFQELDKYVKFGEFFVDIDAESLPELNKPAKIVFRNVEAEADNFIIVLKDGEDPGTSVSNLNYNPATLEASFEVTDFSMYELKVIDQDSTYENPYNGSNLNNSGLILILIFGSIATAILLVYLIEKNKQHKK